MSGRMSVLRINKLKTLKNIHKYVNELKCLGVDIDEIHSDIDFIGVKCCSTYRYGDFYKYYYQRLSNYFSTKIRKIKLIRLNEVQGLYLDTNEEDPRQAGLILSDGYVSSFVSQYVGGDISDEVFSECCIEIGIEKTDLLAIIANYYSTKVVV